MENFQRSNFKARLGNRLHRPHPADAFVTARKHPFVRTDEFRAARFERFHVFLRGRVQPHFAVHRRRDQNFRLRIQRQRDARQRVVRQAVRQFRDHIRRRRRDEQKVRRIRHFDVRRLPAFLLVVKTGHDRMAREHLERQRRDEPLRVGGHHHAHAAFLFRQQAGQIRRLVRGNGAGHAENDVFLHLDRNLNLNPSFCQSDTKADSEIKTEIQNSGACDRAARIFSASTIASIRRKSS